MRAPPPSEGQTMINNYNEKSDNFKPGLDKLKNLMQGAEEAADCHQILAEAPFLVAIRRMQLIKS